jgi:hypothetical protein
VMCDVDVVTDLIGVAYVEDLVERRDAALPADRVAAARLGGDKRVCTGKSSMVAEAWGGS